MAVILLNGSHVDVAGSPPLKYFASRVPPSLSTSLPLYSYFSLPLPIYLPTPPSWSQTHLLRPKKTPVRIAASDISAAKQAVLIADNFRKRMSPLTYTTPKCLLPGEKSKKPRRIPSDTSIRETEDS